MSSAIHMQWLEEMSAKIDTLAEQSPRMAAHSNAISEIDHEGV